MLWKIKLQKFKLLVIKFSKDTFGDKPFFDVVIVFITIHIIWFIALNPKRLLFFSKLFVERTFDSLWISKYVYAKHVGKPVYETNFKMKWNLSKSSKV